LEDCVKRDYLALHIDRELAQIVSDQPARDQLLDRLISIFEESCKRSKKKSAEAAYSLEFEAFWKRYAKGSKLNASVEFAKLTPQEQVLAHAALDWQTKTTDWVNSVNKVDGKDYRLDTERWLKRHRWEDPRPVKAAPVQSESLRRRLEIQRDREKREAAEREAAGRDREVGKWDQ
jgi:hypothetical protein